LKPSTWPAATAQPRSYSHRSGETEDTFIADLAVATGVGRSRLARQPYDRVANKPLAPHRRRTWLRRSYLGSKASLRRLRTGRPLNEAGHLIRRGALCTQGCWIPIDLYVSTFLLHTLPLNPEREYSMYKVVLTRHGESVWNKENLFTGWTDVDLSEKGQEEAAAGRPGCSRARISLRSRLHLGVNARFGTLWTVLTRWTRCGFRRADWRLNERHYGGCRAQQSRND